MWQELREYWLPLMLYVATLLVAVLLVIAVIVLPFVAEYLPFSHRVIELLTNDTTVRRTCFAGAAGLVVTALMFFRPNASVLSKRNKKPPQNTIAGA